MYGFGLYDTNLCDVRSLVSVLTHPPNCTSRFLPMNIGIIAALYATYKTNHVKAISSILIVRAALQEACKHVKPGQKKLAKDTTLIFRM